MPRACLLSMRAVVYSNFNPLVNQGPFTTALKRCIHVLQTCLITQKMRAAQDVRGTQTTVSVDRRRRFPALRPSSVPAADVRSVTSTCYTFNRDLTGTRRVYAVPSAVKLWTRPARASCATVVLIASVTTTGQFCRLVIPVSLFNRRVLIFVKKICRLFVKTFAELEVSILF